jgi:hypothetical protein
MTHLASCVVLTSMAQAEPPSTATTSAFFCIPIRDGGAHVSKIAELYKKWVPNLPL